MLLHGIKIITEEAALPALARINVYCFSSYLFYLLTTTHPFSPSRVRWFWFKNYLTCPHLFLRRYSTYPVKFQDMEPSGTGYQNEASLLRCTFSYLEMGVQIGPYEKASSKIFKKLEKDRAAYRIVCSLKIIPSNMEIENEGAKQSLINK
ncbi:hypothetical protein ACU8KH_02485 [Lachancea thermotolerans]